MMMMMMSVCSIKCCVNYIADLHSFLCVLKVGVECCSYENPDYGYYSTRGEECAMLASSADSHSPAGESNVVTTPGSSLHSSLMTSGDDQSTLLGRRSCPGFRSLFCYLVISMEMIFSHLYGDDL